MPAPITLEQLENAATDSSVLAQLMTGSASPGTVVNRVGGTLYTWAKIQSLATDAAAAAAASAAAAEAAVGLCVTVDTLAALRSYNGGLLANNRLFFVRGYAAAGDGGAGFFRCVTSSPGSDDDGVLITSATSGYYFKRVFSGPVHSWWYGVFSGNSASTNATRLANLIAAPYDVHFDGSGTIQTNALLTIGRSNVRITFDRGCSIVQTGADSNSTLFWADGKSNIQIVDGTLTPGGTTSVTLLGWAVSFRSCTNCHVLRTEVKNHRRGGVIFNSCTDCTWEDLYAHDGLVDPGSGDTHEDSGYDGLIANGCTRCHGNGGRSFNGAGIAFAIQTVDSNSGSGYTVTNCSIRADIVYNSPMYALMTYRLNSNDVFRGIALEFGIIDTVTGAVPHSSEGYVYGAGVYIQGVERVRLSGKYIRNVCVDTLLETLAPAAVGVANCRVVYIDVGMIDTSAWYGIALFDPNESGLTTPGDGATVNFGTILNCAGGIGIKDFPRATISGRILSCTGLGVWAHNASTTTCDRYDLTNLVIDDCSDTPIQVEDGDLYLSGGYARNAAGGNFTLRVENGSLFMQNYTLDGTYATLRPLDIDTGISGKRIEFGDGVVITASNQSGHVGDVARLYRPIKNFHKARIINASATEATAFPGDFQIMNRLGNGDATPSVRDMHTVLSGGTTTITAFDDMDEGQVLIFLAGHSLTIQHSASIICSGGTDITLAANNVVTFQKIGGVCRQIGYKV
jgi:hypothetical protein